MHQNLNLKELNDKNVMKSTTANLPPVSIFWLNYNSYKIRNIVKASLKSILELDYPNFELIVIDNGSTDGSWELINEWLKELDQRGKARVKVVRLSKNFGFTGGNNFAYRLMDKRSKYIVLLNNDVIVLKDSLKKLVVFMESHPDVGAAQGIILRPDFRVDNAGAYLSEFLASVPAYMGLLPCSIKNAYCVTYTSGAYSIYRVEALRKAGLENRIFDWEFFAYYDDNVLGLRLWQSGYKVVVIPHVTGIHLGSATFGKHTFRRYYHAVAGWIALNELSNSRFKRLNRLLILLFTLRLTIVSLLRGGASRKNTPLEGYIAGLKIASRKKEKFDLYKAPVLCVPPHITIFSIFLRRMLNRYLLKIEPQLTFKFRN